ncbi:MAG TPA: DNA-binding protein [Rhizomicrobium sp.]|jgi:hypothetical protein|nr:DNA-binding protein [Rhizomicrobium sp.]
MAVPLKDILDALPPKRRAELDRRFKELVDEVESLKELRRLSAKSQVKIAKALKISQPAVSKIEKQTDMYLSTLRSYVESIGGELNVIVRLPNRKPVRVKSLEEIDAA